MPPIPGLALGILAQFSRLLVYLRDIPSDSTPGTAPTAPTAQSSSAINEITPDEEALSGHL
jgi:hypothetical protein